MLEVVIGELVVQNPISSRFNAMIQRALIFFETGQLQEVGV